MYPLKISGDVLYVPTSPWRNPTEVEKILQRGMQYVLLHYGVNGKIHLLSKTWNEFELFIIQAALQSILISLVNDFESKK